MHDQSLFFAIKLRVRVRVRVSMLIRFEKVGKGLDVNFFCCVAASSSELFQTE